MKTAKASISELEMAMELAGALEALSSRLGATMPEKIAKPQRDDEAEGFSLDDDENCRRVCEYLIRMTRSVSLSRVVCNSAAMAGIAARKAIPLADWNEDVGVTLWWRFPVEEPPYCGSPTYDDWPGYHTHWTPILVPHEPSVDVVDDAT